jgi:two-component system response regulator DesR
MPASIYIVEDQRDMVRTLKAVLNMHDDLSVVGTAQEADTALDEIATLDVDLALVDVSLPKTSGLDLVQTLRETAPSVRCLMLSGRTEPKYVRRARKVQAAGFVLKGRPADLLDAIRTVLEGEEYVTPRLKTVWASASDGAPTRNGSSARDEPAPD